MKNKTPLYAILVVAVIALVLGASAIANANTVETNMNNMMGSMDKMVKHCEQMMGGDMSEMMEGDMSGMMSGGMMSGMMSGNMMGDTGGAISKPEGMSMEEHLSHHPELQR